MIFNRIGKEKLFQIFKYIEESNVISMRMKNFRYIYEVDQVKFTKKFKLLLNLISFGLSYLSKKLWISSGKKKKGNNLVW